MESTKVEVWELFRKATRSELSAHLMFVPLHGAGFTSSVYGDVSSQPATEKNTTIIKLEPDNNPRGIPSGLAHRDDVINPVYQTVSLKVNGEPKASVVLVRFKTIEDKDRYIPIMEDIPPSGADACMYYDLCDYLNYTDCTIEYREYYERAG